MCGGGGVCGGVMCVGVCVCVGGVGVCVWVCVGVCVCMCVYRHVCLCTYLFPSRCEIRTMHCWWRCSCACISISLCPCHNRSEEIDEFTAQQLQDNRGFVDNFARGTAHMFE